MSYKDAKDPSPLPLYIGLVIAVIYVLTMLTSLYGKEYYDLCNGKEYTVSDNVLIASDMKDRNVTETGVPFAPWIVCTDEDMNISSVKHLPFRVEIAGKIYELHLREVSAGK